MTPIKAAAEVDTTSKYVPLRVDSSRSAATLYVQFWDQRIRNGFRTFLKSQISLPTSPTRRVKNVPSPGETWWKFFL